MKRSLSESGSIPMLSALRDDLYSSRIDEWKQSIFFDTVWADSLWCDINGNTVEEGDVENARSRNYAADLYYADTSLFIAFANGDHGERKDS